MHIRVVTALIEREGRYLITRLRPVGILAWLWEFPGGKVEPGETDDTAVRREIRDRVGVDVMVGCMKAHRTHHYVGYAVDLVLYEANIIQEQDLRPLRVAEFRWVAPLELEQYPFPPADQATAYLLLGIRRGRPDGGFAPRAQQDGS
jgi:8-oxo-dGTP diphosphatase